MNLTPDAIVFASSSGGTQAGLTLGAGITGFKGQSVLFWHTGGTPELFAWAGDFKK